MPWLPELFSGPALERLEERRARRLERVPYFDGLMTGEADALVESFAGPPRLHDPLRGRIEGADAFRRFVSDTNAWLAGRDAAVDDPHLILLPGRCVEEVVAHIDGDRGRIALPVALISEHAEDGRITELRVYHSTWPLTGRHAIRAPLLQPHVGVREADVVAQYLRALTAGDLEAVLAAFEPDAYMREPAGDGHVHRGSEELRDLYSRFFSNGGGIALEHCTVTDDGRSCALEYNVTGWGRTELPPQAGIAVYERGDSGRLAAARIYDDIDPPTRRTGT